MIEVYTDASVSHGNAVATVFVTSSEMFIGFNSFEYSGVNSSLHGELLGMRDGIRYAISNNPNRLPITVYCDSASALSLVKGLNAGDKKSKQFKNLVAEIHSICKGYSINFLLIKGHQMEHNPNKVVDLISNSVLRYSFVKE